jgi:hypothetical protein
VSPMDRFDPDALLLGYSAGELTTEEQAALFQAAAVNQDLFDQLMDAEAIRHALSFPEQRKRAGEVLNAWEFEQAGNVELAATSGLSSIPLESHQPESVNYAALENRLPHPTHARFADLLRSALTTVATTLLLRICYSLLTAIGASLLVPGVQLGGAQIGILPPVPPILHLVQAAIAALLLAVQFTPFLNPQVIAERGHPIARKSLAQFIAGWRWAWAFWLMLYLWLWLHASSGAQPDPIADILNCLTSFPLFWCFFVLDKPSIALPGYPERNAAFWRAVGTTWGIGVGVCLMAVAGRLHLWGLNEFGLVFLGLYDGLAIAFLVGRFDSHWMKVPRWMLVPLYGYALIQMIWVFFFKLPAEWQIYSYLVALLFKVCLFLVVTHLLHAGNLRRYLEAAEEGKLGPQTDASTPVS